MLYMKKHDFKLQVLIHNSYTDLAMLISCMECEISILKQIFTFKAMITASADDIEFYLPEMIRLDISCESSASQMIHMKYRLTFSEI